MKLLVIIVQDADANELQKQLTKNDYRATKLTSTGGFLREGNTTFLMAIKDEELPFVKVLIAENCKERTQTMPTRSFYLDETGMSESMEVVVGGAVVFVLPLEEMFRL